MERLGGGGGVRLGVPLTDFQKAKTCSVDSNTQFCERQVPGASHYAMTMWSKSSKEFASSFAKNLVTPVRRQFV